MHASGQQLNAASVTVGITTYNEESTLPKALDRVLQERRRVPFDTVIVAGGIDRTVQIATEYASRFQRIQVIRDEPRHGKPWAINQVFSAASGDIIVLLDGDVLIAEESIKSLLDAFRNPQVGAATARVVPLNTREGPFGFWAHFLFFAAHLQRLRESRESRLFHLTGYLSAVRREKFEPLPEDSLADDAVLGLSITRRNLKIVYVPESHVFVRFPESIRDFIAQKRRTFAGFRQIKAKYGVSSRGILQEARDGLILGVRFCRTPMELLYLVVLAGLRAILWVVAFIDIKLRRGRMERLPWPTIPSTKRID